MKPRRAPAGDFRRLWPRRSQRTAVLRHAVEIAWDWCGGRTIAQLARRWRTSPNVISEAIRDVMGAEIRETIISVKASRSRRNGIGPRGRERISP